MFVEVPINVQTPPNIDANERGIKSFEGLMLFFLAAFNKIGIKTATTGVLLMKAEIIAITHIVTISAVQKPYLNILVDRSPKKRSAPVLFKAALTINSAPTVIVAGLLKPETASNGVSIPVAIKATITIMAVRSTGIFSSANSIIVPRRIRNTKKISNVIKSVFYAGKDFRYDKIMILSSLANAGKQKELEERLNIPDIHSFI